jgi:hypothetical protein
VGQGLLLREFVLRRIGLLPTAFAVGDFNADGYGDVAIAGGSSSGGWDIDVRLGSSSKK